MAQKLLLLVLCSIFTVQLAVAAISREIVPQITGKPIECPVQELNGTLKVGETVQAPEYCGEISCSKQGEELIITRVSCGSIGGIPEGTILVSDPTKPYPECCPRPQQVTSTPNIKIDSSKH